MDGKEALKVVAVLTLETVALVIIFRVIMNPDTMRTNKLRVIKAVEQACENNARGWAHAADGARLLYETSRSTV